ncbi:MAG: GNAT family N-acetyltransferase [Candidatus Ranarchaeia archaeon]
MSTSKIIISPVKRDELKKVVEVNRTCLPENYPGSFFVQMFTKYPYGFLVAKSNDEIIGYIMCKIDRSFHKFQWIKKGHVVSIAVLPEYRRKKIGEKLLKNSLGNMSKVYGAIIYTLEVRETNYARKFYEDLGFKEKKVLSDYYADGENGIEMERSYWDEIKRKEIPK